MPNGDSSDQWFLEVNGKKFGPYTMAQINALVQHHEIVGEDRVTAPHLSGKWISVQEFVSQNQTDGAPKRNAKTISQQAPAQPSAAPATVPPRPDERTLTSITAPAYHAPNEKRDTESKAILNLFEILQAARERKPQTPTAVGHQLVEMPRPVKSTSGGGGLLWFAVPALAVAAVMTWKMTSSTNNTEVAEIEPSSKVTKHQTAAAPAAQPVAPRAAAPVAPPAKPKTMASLSSGFAAGRQPIRPSQPAINDRERDRERERELEREKEREAERELEREKERESEYTRSYSSNDPSSREKERELERQEEREGRQPADQQRGGFSSAGAGGAQNNVLPVTGGIPVDPAAQFRDLSSDAENPRPTN